MKRLAVAALLAATAPAVLAHAAQAQTAAGTGDQAVPGSAAPAAPAPAGDAPQKTPEQIADQGATPTSGGQPEGEVREGTTVYRPDFFAAARPTTALDMVNRLPGFQLNTGTSARGFAGTAGNALIDGKHPASKSDNVSDVLARIPATQVDRIEVIRGGAPGIDMQGQSVVANIIRRAGNASQQVLTVATHWFLQSGDQLPSARYEMSRTIGPRTYEFAIGRSIGMDDSVGRGTRIRRGPGGEVIRSEIAGNEGDGGGVSSKATVKTPLFGGELRGNATYGDSIFKSEDHFTRVDTPAPNLDVVQRSKNRNGELGLNYTRPLTPRIGMEVVGLQRLSQSGFRSTSDQGSTNSAFLSEADSGESILRSVLRYKHTDTLSLEGGAEAAFNFRDGRTAFTQDGTAVPIPNANIRVEERRGEAFATATWRPFASLGVEGGSRFEFSTISSAGGAADLERSFLYPKPRLLFTWTPNKADTFRLRLEREVGQLNFGDFVASANLTDNRVVAGNPELEPDQTNVIEASFERRFWEKGAVSLTFSHQRITDVIDRLPITALDAQGNPFIFDAPGNIGDGVQNEVDVNLTLPLDRFRLTGAELKVSLELIDSEVTDPATGEPRPISGKRPEVLEFEFRHDLPRWKLTYGGVYFNGFEETYYRFNEITRVSIDRFIGLFLEYKPGPQTTVRLELNNAGRFELLRQRLVFEGPRHTEPLRFTEDYSTQSQQRAFIRIRRTFD